MKLRRYESGDPDTPVALQRCFEAGSVPAIMSKGSLDILDGRLIGFFCSVRCPGDVILKTYDLARALRNAERDAHRRVPVANGERFSGFGVTGSLVRRSLPGAGARHHADSKRLEEPVSRRTPPAPLLLRRQHPSPHRRSRSHAQRPRRHPRPPPPHRPRRKRRQNREAMRRGSRPRQTCLRPRLT